MIRFLKIAIPVFIVGFVAGNAFWYLAVSLAQFRAQTAGPGGKGV